jgi:hypothetical protein
MKQVDRLVDDLLAHAGDLLPELRQLFPDFYVWNRGQLGLLACLLHHSHDRGLVGRHEVVVSFLQGRVGAFPES